MTQRRARISSRRLLAWGLFVATLAAIVLWRFQPAYTLDLFLPEPETAAQKVLVERVGQGPAANWLMIRIGGEAAIESARDLKQQLLESGLFLQVDNGERDELLIPEPLWTWRYLLRDREWSEAALAADFNARLADLALGGGPELRQMIQADPGFDALAVLEKLQSPAAPAEVPWRTSSGDALLVAETRASAFDTEGQQQALTTINELATTDELSMTGSGVFSARLSEIIRSEATLRSALATFAILMVLLLAYRSIRLVVLSALPLGLGVLAGLAAVALVFSQVHGITLAFGFTLIGIAIDFPLHLFSHARHQSPQAAMRSVWPTLFLGGISTVIAYAALIISGSVGLAQLGLFAAAGVTTAILVTRYLLPWLLPDPDPLSSSETVSSPDSLNIWPALTIAVGMGITLLWMSPIWNPSLAALSPVPQSWLEENNELRTVLGAPDFRYVAAVRGTDQQSVLEANENATKVLDQLVAEGLLEGWQNSTILLPSIEKQTMRQAVLPDSASLESRMQTVLADSPFRADAFTPFLNAVEISRALPVLTLEDFAMSPLLPAIHGQLYQADQQWVGLTQFYGISHPASIGAALSGTPLYFIDLKTASDSLIERYRVRALSLLLTAVALVTVFLALQVGLGWRLIWIMITVTAGVLTAATVALLIDGSLTLFHLIALILVTGLSLDYALFLSRPDGGSKDTRHAVTACVASTTLAFGVLALSEIPMLHWLGLTVAGGALASYLLARSGTLAIRSS